MMLIKPEMLTSSRETVCALEAEVHSELVNKQEITCTDVITASNVLGLQSKVLQLLDWTLH